MAAAALLRMLDRVIYHHFHGNQRNGRPHCRGITVTVDFPQFPQYYHCTRYHAGLCYVLTTECINQLIMYLMCTQKLTGSRLISVSWIGKDDLTRHC